MSINPAPITAAGGTVGSWGVVAWSFIDPLYTVLQGVALVAAIAASITTTVWYVIKIRRAKKLDK